MKIGTENLKMLFFDSPKSKNFTRYQKILRGCSFVCKNLLNFTCLTMKFNNCHHAKPHSGYYLIVTQMCSKLKTSNNLFLFIFPLVWSHHHSQIPFFSFVWILLQTVKLNKMTTGIKSKGGKIHALSSRNCKEGLKFDKKMFSWVKIS